MTQTFAFVGSRTTRERNARGEGISVFAVEGDRLQRTQLVTGLENPSFLAVNRAGTFLFAVHGDRRDVSAFAIEDGATLRHVNTASCEGRNPVHLALDPTERWLVVSNHLNGELAVLDVAEDGSLGNVRQLERLPGEPGPHRVEQPHSKPHFNPFDPSGRFVVVPDKGLDRIFSFRFEAGRLVPGAVPWVQCREGAGPRHVAFHPALAVMYAINELDSTVCTYSFDRVTGELEAIEILPSTPSTFTGNNRAAEIEVDRQGKFVYASNRGDDSISVFRAAPETGRLEFVASTPAGGRTPRFFTLSPGGRHLHVLNEDSDSIVTFRVAGDGTLIQPGKRVACGSPVCMVFAAR